MAGIVNKEFPELAQTGMNYLSWSSDCEIWFKGKGLLRAIGNGTLLAPTDPKFAPENAQALHFLHHHLCPTLKDEYMAERSASGLWTALKQRFERVMDTVKPRAETEWIRPRFADFKTVGEYNSALHRICTTLQLCGTEVTDTQKIEKTLSTFHPDAVQSSWNYHQGNYTRYSELIDLLQVAEAQDEVLKKNFVAQPLGGSSRQEVNALKVCKPLQKKRGRKGKKKGPQPPTPAKQQKPGKGEQRPQDCFRCGSLEHFSRECRAPKEVVAAYKVRKERETHLALVQEQSPLAAPAAPVMIATPPPTPLVATSVVPIAAALAVSNDADVAMEVEHMVDPMGPPLDVDAATKMMTIEEGLTSLEI
uniref:CCHC-type domain-containing protein n=1 Tax=Hordeum vulgare subsp. vulgare TaxID=112509 RepID=A0A8I7B5G4_HORVV